MASKIEWTYSGQKGIPGHCHMAQVWANGKNLAEIEPTENEEEATANARLMAAAPDMLEALRAAMRVVDLWSPNYSKENMEPSEIGELAALSMMRQNIEKAIAKALSEPEV